MRVLVIPDKFKGTLTAREAADAIAHGWSRARPHDSVVTQAMSDGGDGFGAVMGELLGAVTLQVNTCDAAHRPCRARWWWHRSSKTAVIESAAVVGLAMLPVGRYHPFELDSRGLAKVITTAIRKGARRILVGLGGSATNDAGFGLARGLGWKFFGPTGELIERWIELEKLESVSPPMLQGPMPEVIGAVDVQNLLLGPKGATRVYGPQKGLMPADFPTAERCFRRLSAVLLRSGQPDLGRLPGAGAAGGLGFGIAAFLGGRLQPGFDLYWSETGLLGKLRNADLVITGEGAIDESTFMGKGAGEIAARCRALKVPCLALAGRVDLPRARRSGFLFAKGLTELASPGKALSSAAYWLERLAFTVARSWPDSTIPVVRSQARSHSSLSRRRA
jgi:glycerate 2-kinase